MATPPPFAPRKRYVLLPARGLQSAEMSDVSAGPDGGFQRAVAARRRLLPAGTARPRKPDILILHSLADTGPKLAEMGAEAALALRISHPGIKAVPVVYYHPARQARLKVTVPTQAECRGGLGGC